MGEINDGMRMKTTFLGKQGVHRDIKTEVIRKGVGPIITYGNESV